MNKKSFMGEPPLDRTISSFGGPFGFCSRTADAVRGAR
jgi:hypothetical protein